MHQVARRRRVPADRDANPRPARRRAAPAVSAPACRAAVTCSGVHDVGTHQRQAVQPVSTNPPRPGTEANPTSDPDRDPRQLHTGLRRHPTPGVRHSVAGEHRHEQLDPGVERGAASTIIGRRLVEHRELAVAVDAEAEAEHHRPADRRSSEVAAWATSCGRRRGSAATIVPISTRSVATAIAASVTNGSANGASVRFHRWSHTNTPCQPACSAVAATSATTPGSDSSPDNEIDRPHRTTRT